MNAFAQNNFYYFLLLKTLSHEKQISMHSMISVVQQKSVTKVEIITKVKQYFIDRR